MTAEMMLPLIMRWIHIVCAVVVVGSIFFYRMVVLPASKHAFEEGMPEAFKTALMKKWKLLLHPPIILFLVSGMYYYLAVTRFMHDGQSLYHALFGVKFLLALVVFALYITLTSTMKWSESVRDKKVLWVLLILLMTGIVMIGGVMRTMPIVLADG
jgi:uncharacterized membrane protein